MPTKGCVLKVVEISDIVAYSDVLAIVTVSRNSMAITCKHQRKRTDSCRVENVVGIVQNLSDFEFSLQH